MLKKEKNKLIFFSRKDNTSAKLDNCHPKFPLPFKNIMNEYVENVLNSIK